MNDGWLTLEELAGILNTSYDAVKKALKRGKFSMVKQVEVKGKGSRGGKVWLVNVEDPFIPVDVRVRYLKGEGQLVAVQCGGDVSSTILQYQVPERYKRIALARLDLVRLWRQHRQEGSKKSEVDEAFVQAYNCQLIGKGIYDVIGEVSVKSLYRWADMLGNTDDWQRLIPQWRVGEVGNQLSKEERDVFLRFLLSPSRHRVGSAISLTKYFLKSKGIESLSSPMTFRRFAERWAEKNKDVWVLMREGQKALKDNLEFFIRRDPSVLNVGDVLVADGHRLNFQVVNPFTGKPCRAVLVGYVDWKAFALVGYEIMLEENTQCVASALRNAILRLGQIPKITYQDNGKAFRARFFTGQRSDFENAGLYGLFARLGIIPVFAQPYNARAKVIERWFQEFSNTFEKLMPSYTGSSVVDKPAYMMRNERFHKALHNEYVPRIDEVVEWVEGWLQFDYAKPCPHAKGKSKGEVLEVGRGAGVDVAMLDDLMMDCKVSQVGRHGIRFLGAEYYDEALYGMSAQVVVRYSLFDLTKVKVYDTKGRFLCEAQRRMLVNPMAQYMGDVKDVEEFKRQVALQRRLRRQTIQRAKDVMSGICDGELITPPDPLLNKRGELLGGSLNKSGELITHTDTLLNKSGELITPPDPLLNERGELLDDGEKPFFGDDAVARYEWHLKNGFRTDEDLEFKVRFEASDEYRLLFEFFNSQQRKEVSEK